MLIATLLLISIMSFSQKRAYAVTKTPTPTVSTSPSKTPTTTPQSPTTEKLNEQISDLKERIASRVAQLKLVERRGIVGTVTDITDTQITLTDVLGNTRFADVDELTKFYPLKQSTSFGISDIKKGSRFGVLGLYNKQSRRILARFVNEMNIPKTIRGIIASVDAKNYSFIVVSEESRQTIVDVENTTKTSSYTKSAGLVKSGFSKISEKQNVIVTGFTDSKDKNKIIASRILLFPETEPNPLIKIPDNLINPNTEETVTPSTGSGKKLTPIK